MRILAKLVSKSTMTAGALLVFLSAANGQGQKSSRPFTVINIASEAGLNFKENNFATEKKYPFETTGGAVAALDYNNDGCLDLLFLNGAPSPQHLKTDPASFNHLYRNNGDGSFTDVTQASGLRG
jgi:hypothetical protein